MPAPAVALQRRPEDAEAGPEAGLGTRQRNVADRLASGSLPPAPPAAPRTGRTWRRLLLEPLPVALRAQDPRGVQLPALQGISAGSAQAGWAPEGEYPVLVQR